MAQTFEAGKEYLATYGGGTKYLSVGFTADDVDYLLDKPVRVDAETAEFLQAVEDHRFTFKEAPPEVKPDADGNIVDITKLAPKDRARYLARRDALMAEHLRTGADATGAGGTITGSETLATVDVLNAQTAQTMADAAQAAAAAATTEGGRTKTKGSGGGAS